MAKTCCLIFFTGLLGVSSAVTTQAATTTAPTPPTTKAPPIDCENETLVIETAIPCFLKPLEALLPIFSQREHIRHGRKLMSTVIRSTNPWAHELREDIALAQDVYKTLSKKSKRGTVNPERISQAIQQARLLKMSKGGSHHKSDGQNLINNLIADIFSSLSPVKYHLRNLKKSEIVKKSEQMDPIGDLIDLLDCLEKFTDFEDDISWLSCLYSCDMAGPIATCVKEHFAQCPNISMIGDYVTRGFVEAIGLHTCYFKGNTTGLTVEEGGPAQIVEFQMYLPPYIYCVDMADISADGLILALVNFLFGEDGDGDCNAEIQFSLSNYLMEAIPDVRPIIGHAKCKDDSYMNQAVIGQHVGAVNNNFCHLPLTETNWNQTQRIPVTATVDYQQDDRAENEFTMKLMAHGTVLNSTKIPMNVIDRDFDKPHTCASVNDPHITTFDGWYYNNHHEGHFILYQHTELPYQVQAVYQRCNATTDATCNCAVSVQSGDDVLTVDRCRRRCNEPECNGQLRTVLHVNDKLTPGTRVFRKYGGMRFEVLLPHGQYVKIQTSGPSLNVWVEPNPYDLKKTKGLCGVYNGNEDDDLTMRNGTIYRGPGSEKRGQPRPFSLSWRVGAAERIFSGVASAPTTVESFCRCHHVILEGVQSTCGVDALLETCDLDTDGEITNELSMISRSVTNQPERLALAGSVISTDAPIDIDETWEPVNHTWKSWTKSEAESYCKNITEVGHPLGRKCSNELYQYDINEVQYGCEEDIQITDGTDWAGSAVEAMKEYCLEFARREDINKKAYEAYKALRCINDCHKCLGQGICSNGACTCQSGFAGADCSMDRGAVPRVTGMPNGGLCDSRYDDCASVIVFGMNFLEEESVTCTVREVEVNDKEVRIIGNEKRVMARFLSSNQIVCPLGKSASFRVTVASKSLLHIVHDSACFRCDHQAQRCSRRPQGTYCYIHGTMSNVTGDHCIAANQRHADDRCRYCNTTVSTTKWTYFKDEQCAKKEKDDLNRERIRRLANTLRIVFAVLLSVLIIAIAVVLFIFSSRKKERVLNVDYDEPIKRKEGEISSKGDGVMPAADTVYYKKKDDPGPQYGYENMAMTNVNDEKPQRRVDSTAEEPPTGPLAPGELQRLKEEAASGRARTSSTGSAGIGGGGPVYLGRFTHMDYPTPDGTVPPHAEDEMLGIGGHGGGPMQLPKMSSHNLHKADLPVGRP